MPASPTRSLRIPDLLWDEAQRVARESGTSVNAVVIRDLEEFITDGSWRARALHAEAQVRLLLIGGGSSLSLGSPT